MISVRELRKFFGAVRAVNGVSFSARDGSITGLLGPNGAGKTTTLRMLYTLMRADAGRIVIDGIDAALDPAAARRRLGVLPDARGLYKNLTARENIEYFAHLQGMSASAAATSVRNMIQALNMSEFAERRAEGFSNGQRLKTAIARALIHSPRNIVMDEPTNGLDVMATRSLRDFLMQLKSEGHCVLVSTHIMQEVVALCDHVVVLAHGRVVAEGSPESLREQAHESNLEDAFIRLISRGPESLGL